VGPSEFAHQRQRVVVGQRLMQAASDMFLGRYAGQVTADYEALAGAARAGRVSVMQEA
jgi:hypothetical protein